MSDLPADLRAGSSGAVVHPLRPRVALARVLSVLGPSLLTARWMPSATGDVMDVVIWDAADAPAASIGDLVLGVGVHDPALQRALLAGLSASGCAGLVVKCAAEPHDPLPAGLIEAAEAAGVPLVQLTNGASWEQIVLLIRSLVFSGTPAAEGSPRSGLSDLFTLAEVMSAVLGAPVTIEDRSSRVLAFSEDQSDVDAARAETILGRRVPDRYVQKLSDRGVFRRLLEEPRPLYLDAVDDGMKPRTAVTVRAGQEVLGSIWAATSERLSAEREQWLADAAAMVALQLLRLRSETDVRQRMWSEHMAALLSGGRQSLEMASRLGLGSGPACVVAATVARADGAAGEAELQRLEISLSVHLTAVRPRTVVARLHDVVYAVVSPVDDGDDADRGPAALLQEYVDYADLTHVYRVGVGRAAPSFGAIARSRADADAALRALRTDTRGRQVVRFADVQLDALLLRMVDLLGDEGYVATGPLAALSAYDQRHRSSLVETLAAYLDAFGDVSAAAKAVHVHVNTFRYRLRRLSAIGGIDLDDPQVRFTMMLQLRLLRLGARSDASLTAAPRLDA